MPNTFYSDAARLEMIVQALWYIYILCDNICLLHFPEHSTCLIKTKPPSYEVYLSSAASLFSFYINLLLLSLMYYAVQMRDTQLVRLPVACVRLCKIKIFI